MLCVADPECLSRIQDPQFYSFRIPDPKIPAKDSCHKKMVCKSIFCYSQICRNSALILFFICSKKNLAKFIMNYLIFYANCHRPLKKFLYPLSGIREKDIPDRGSRTQKCSGSRIPDPDPQNSLQYLTL